MIGVNAVTGEVLDGEEHLKQSIADLLMTEIGSRVMTRDYGSEIPRLIDSPINGQTLLEFIVAIHTALDRWEPRLIVKRVSFMAGLDIEAIAQQAAAGSIGIRLEGVYTESGQPALLEGIEIGRRTA